MSSFDKSVSSLTESMARLSVKREAAAGCNIPAIVSMMYNEQSDHLFCRFSDAFIKYRQVVVEWMIDVAEYFRLHPTTTHAAIAYLDRLQPNERFSRFEWQMLAICCLILSSKYNEMEEHVPCLEQLEAITQQRITNDCVLNYELWALKRMGWKLNARTPMAFLTCFIAQGIIAPTDSYESQEAWNENYQSRKKYLERQMVKLATKTIINVQYKPLQASAVAAAIVYIVRQQYRAMPVWCEGLSYVCLHDPMTSKNVQRVVELHDTLLDEEEAVFMDAKSSEEEVVVAGGGSLHTPVQQKHSANKENSKPLSEISPIAIADMNNVA